MALPEECHGSLDGAYNEEYGLAECPGLAGNGKIFVWITRSLHCILTCVQSLFLQGTPNPQPSFFLVAAAIRLSHSIGLHKRGSGFGLNPVEVEQRKRVFWIAYLLDKEYVSASPDQAFLVIDWSNIVYVCVPVDPRYKTTMT